MFCRTRAVLSLLPPGADDAISSTVLSGRHAGACARVRPVPTHNAVTAQHAPVTHKARRSRFIRAPRISYRRAETTYSALALRPIETDALRQHSIVAQRRRSRFHSL